MPESEFNRYCEALLVQYSRRNTAATTRRIEGLCAILREEGEVVQTMFGGSVKRGTDVNGLSDVDLLLIVNESSLVSQSPAQVIAHVKASITRRLHQNQVRSGNLAVTVSYSSGPEIQLLPAIRRKSGGVRIAEPGGAAWSRVVQPEKFAGKLVEVNSAKNGRVVPTIKLAKAIADCFIKLSDRRITGYHMESLAIEAFQNYQGALDPKSMLNQLFRNSVQAVMKPIADSSGQSRFVDEYLGLEGSRHRKRTSTYFGQMRGKANSCRTRQDMDSLFCTGSAARGR